MKISKASQKRIEKFAHEFTCSEFVSDFSSQRDNDFFNEPDRANRCYEAAEEGGDGKTHAEAIDDFREAFKVWIFERRRAKFSINPDRFIDAVNAHFDSLEEWHDKNGTLQQEIG